MLLDLTVKAYDTIKPIFTVELEMTPNDPEGAFDRTMMVANATVFSGEDWRLVPQAFFRDGVRALAFGSHGIIPPMTVVLTPDRRITPAPDRLQ
jgi:hypothetical protein